jgi:hypothetical protein
VAETDVKEIIVDYSETPRGYVKKVVLNNGETWRLDGYCCLCGVCCIVNPPDCYKVDGACSQLGDELHDGVRERPCNAFWSRPIGCALYPRDPYETLDKECTYEWVKEA